MKVSLQPWDKVIVYCSGYSVRGKDADYEDEDGVKSGKDAE